MKKQTLCLMVIFSFIVHLTIKAQNHKDIARQNKPQSLPLYLKKRLSTENFASQTQDSIGKDEGCMKNRMMLFSVREPSGVYTPTGNTNFTLPVVTPGFYRVDGTRNTYSLNLLKDRQVYATFWNTDLEYIKDPGHTIFNSVRQKGAIGDLNQTHKMSFSIRLDFL